MLSGKELENPLSLVDKLHFQLYHNNDPKGWRYVKNYYRKIKMTDKYLKRFSSYKPVTDVFDTAIDQPTVRLQRQYLINHEPSIEILLSELKKGLEEK
ncbi:hypothetical protein MKQ70_16530 [Chitinophaga sedimenti]|uniref:hypothetical protein n=1 Tax=Chitinophaga sedimenti TaxID=2033606 RepID=UPI002004FD26|nr:hypothetical protein [Chitinophaga sedimenti]MCK7556535.1 hypothetical protein [Chitinophaga sedimenti]